MNFSLLYLIILIPAVSSAILLLGGKFTDSWGHLLGTAAPLASFVIGVVAFTKLRDNPDQPADTAPLHLVQRRHSGDRVHRQLRPASSTSCRRCSCC